MGDGVVPGGGGRGKLRTIAFVVYGTLFLLLLAMPEEIASRLDDLPDSAPVRVAQTTVGGIVRFSNWVGIAKVYRAARDRFVAAAGLGGP
jgi:hypothetical protein